jgi:ferredoxin--NADP+ reductase
MTPEHVAELRQKRYNATITGIEQAHSDLVRLRVRPDFPLQAHSAGQYTTLGLGFWEPRLEGCQPETLKPGDEERLVRRSYSISCPVLDEQGRGLWQCSDWLEFYIVLVRQKPGEQGPGLTPRLFLLKTGDRLNMGERITGHYTLEHVSAGDTVIFLGTGTGEAPHNYMLWELLGRNHQGRVLSVSCVRYQRDLGYLKLHEELMRRFPRYTYMGLTTREATTIGRKVYIQDLITSGQLEDVLGQPLDPQRTHVFLCGNPSMIGVKLKDPQTGQWSYPQPTGAIEVLEKRGFVADNRQQKIEGNIHFEEYW